MQYPLTPQRLRRPLDQQTVRKYAAPSRWIREMPLPGDHHFLPMPSNKPRADRCPGLTVTRPDGAGRARVRREPGSR
jgi:hypothetical protein